MKNKITKFIITNNFDFVTDINQPHIAINHIDKEDLTDFKEAIFND